MTSSRLLTDLVPIVQAKAELFEQRCLGAGIEVLIYSTYRDGPAQHEIWRKGRETAGPPCSCGGHENPIGTCPKHSLGLIVTMADSGDSFHQYKVAFDWVPLVHGKPAWNEDEYYDQCGIIAESIGLEWAGRWTGHFKEKGHCQFTDGLTLVDFQAGKTVVA